MVAAAGRSGLVKLAIGMPQDYGLKRPDHRLFESHPIINSQMMYYVGHGDIKPKPDVARFDGQTVHFTDGTSEPIDVIVFATGFNIRFPFIDTEKHLNWRKGRPDLFLNAFHPLYDNLFVAGLVQPDGGNLGPVVFSGSTDRRIHPSHGRRLVQSRIFPPQKVAASRQTLRRGNPLRRFNAASDRSRTLFVSSPAQETHRTHGPVAAC